MAYLKGRLSEITLSAHPKTYIEWVQISAGDFKFLCRPAEAAELVRQIAVALEQLGEVPDSLPPITPPVALSDAEMAEGDLTEQRR